MPAARKAKPAVQHPIQAKLRLIRASVAGVHGSLVATTDGPLVAHDGPGLEPDPVVGFRPGTS